MSNMICFITAVGNMLEHSWIGIGINSDLLAYNLSEESAFIRSTTQISIAISSHFHQGTSDLPIAPSIDIDKSHMIFTPKYEFNFLNIYYHDNKPCWFINYFIVHFFSLRKQIWIVLPKEPGLLHAHSFAPKSPGLWTPPMSYSGVSSLGFVIISWHIISKCPQICLNFPEIFVIPTMNELVFNTNCYI